MGLRRARQLSMQSTAFNSGLVGLALAADTRLPPVILPLRTAGSSVYERPFISTGVTARDLGEKRHP